EHLESVAHAEHRPPGPHEILQLPRQLALHPGREDRARADVIPVRETAGNHEDVIVRESTTERRRRLAGELLQVDLLRLRAEEAEVGRALVLAVRALEHEHRDAHVLALHPTTS